MNILCSQWITDKGFNFLIGDTNHVNFCLNLPVFALKPFYKPGLQVSSVFWTLFEVISLFKRSSLYFILSSNFRLFSIFDVVFIYENLLHFEVYFIYDVFCLFFPSFSYFELLPGNLHGRSNMRFLPSSAKLHLQLG